MDFLRNCTYDIMIVYLPTLRDNFWLKPLDYIKLKIDDLDEKSGGN